MNHIQLLSWLFKNVTHIIHLKEFNICHPAQKPQKHFDWSIWICRKWKQSSCLTALCPPTPPLTPVSDSACSGPLCLRSSHGKESVSVPPWDCWSSAGFLYACSPVGQRRKGEKSQIWPILMTFNIFLGCKPKEDNNKNWWLIFCSKAHTI